MQDGINQLVPKSIRSCSSSQQRLLSARQCKSLTQPNTHQSSLTFDSAIGLYHLNDSVCFQHCVDSRLSIYSRPKSLSFYQSALEAAFIEISNPAFCVQKEFVSAERLRTNEAF